MGSGSRNVVMPVRLTVYAAAAILHAAKILGDLLTTCTRDASLRSVH